MDYEKKYKEALERAKNINNEHRAQPFDVMTRVFPELKESKDEKIRKEIISALKFANVKGVYDKHIAWLEKQGEKKSINDTDEDIVEAVKDTSILDIVERKFHKGDWIAHDAANFVFQIVGVGTYGYTVLDKKGRTWTVTFGNEGNYHLWTIQDANDGDVLSDGTTIFIFKDLLSDGSVMSYCDYDTDSGESDAFCPLSMNLMCLKINPATKEQRDLLFQKIKEAGYEWNAEKRELRKFEQKSAWGEEDKTKIKSIIAFLKSPSLCAMDGNKDIIDENIKYLNSLKERVLPQPKKEWSEEDENMLKSIIATCKLAEQDRDSSPARHLYEMQTNWLKLLKQRMKGE